MLLDPRNFEHIYGSGKDFDIRGWRRWLKDRLLSDREFKSDLTGNYLNVLDVIVGEPIHVHEGIISRAALNASVSWHYMIFHEINCFLLTEAQHIPRPPSRELCYWLAVSRYGKKTVDEWIDSLPWKVPPARTWAGCTGREAFAQLRWRELTIPFRIRVLSTPEIDQEG